MQLAPAIFKAYDIRGIVPATLDDKVARGLGRAFGAAARAEGQTTVAVGRDAAFCFTYAANLQTLEQLGARVVFFSPLDDAALPECDAVWLPGG